MTAKLITVKIAGDSGDGMQFVGEQFTLSCAMAGNALQTYPDFPAEIRAPAGSLEGISGYQVSLSDKPIYAQADELDVLIVLNPAALKKSIMQLKRGGLLLINSDGFEDKDLLKAGYDSNLIFSELRQAYQLLEIPLTGLTIKALDGYGLTHSETKKCKNMYALGILLWLFNLTLEPANQAIQSKFQSKPKWLKANLDVLIGGYHYAMNTELERADFKVLKANMEPGEYRQINGTEAIALALASIAVRCEVPVFLAGYPITPASEILHQAHKLQDYGITTFQAEDEIAASCAALGASYGGRLAFTCTSGPGLDLKQESIGLAVMAELPMVIIDVQRSGPSTGMPTKTEQSDLLSAIYGRHGECPLPVIAAKSPSDCFEALIKATNIAVSKMTPVILLCDAQMANGSEPWHIPKVEELQIIKPKFNQEFAFKRNTHGVPPWVLPGTPGYEYCTGGLEKGLMSGEVSFASNNHEQMVKLRSNKIQSLAATPNGFEYIDQDEAQIILISWGGTYGSVRTLIEESQMPLSMLHLTLLHPLPEGIKSILTQYELQVCIELNEGQLSRLLRDKLLIDIKSITKISGQAFTVSELKARIAELIAHEEYKEH